MADITDPQFLRFCNERLRPMCEQLRNLDLELQAMSADWDEIKAIVSGNTDADPVQDKRDAEGISRLTKKDAVDALTVLLAVKTTMDTARNRASVAKPCVRAARVQSS